MADITTIKDDLVRTREMDVEIGVYFPAGISDADAELFDELFQGLRTGYFVYPVFTLEKIQEYFIQFYNSDRNEKEAILNNIENSIHSHIYTGVVDNIVNDKPAEVLQLYLKLKDPELKTMLLYVIQHGYSPSADEDLSEYSALVGEIDRELDKIDQQASQDSSVADEEQATFEENTPEEVVSRYLKGSGIYDPALRNTGFRVDTDMEPPSSVNNTGV